MFTSKHRSFVRDYFGFKKTTSIAVNIVWGYQPPKLRGRWGGWYTRGGQIINHPSAYARVGWSNMIYRCSTRRIDVGCFWVLKNYGE